jgi:hypothetical protein
MTGDERKVLAATGGPVDEVRVTLGVYGPGLDPAEVTAALGCPPTSAHRRGDSREPATAPWKQGAWLLRMEGKAPSVPEELVQQLLRLLPKDDATWERLRTKHTVRITFGLFTGSWNRGFELSPDSVAFLAMTGAQVGFDIYADAGGDDGAAGA